MKIEARLKLPDGREFEIARDSPGWEEDNAFYYWTEGNMSCDCNLFDEIAEAFPDEDLDMYIPVPLDGQEPIPGYYGCGQRIEMLSLKFDGKEML